MTEKKMDIPVFDPLAWIGRKDEVKTVLPKASTSQQPAASQPLSHSEELAKAKAVVYALMRRGANIADSYGDYVKLGFSLANGLGSDGRHLYHLLCSQSGKYDEAACDRKWNECLRKSDGRTTIATFYHMAQQAGIDLKEISKNY